MANTFYNKVYYIDTAGAVVTRSPLWVRQIVLIPNAAADAATLNFWDENAPYAEGAGTYTTGAILGTITLTTTLTMASGTLLPSTVRDGDVFKIRTGSGSTANHNTYSVVTSAGNNTVIVATNAGWTNEAAKSYNFVTYPYRPAFSILSQATTAKQEVLDFGGSGIWMPNLTIETLSANAKIYLYVR